MKRHANNKLAAIIISSSVLFSTYSFCQTMSEAGITTRTQNYINSSNYKNSIINDSRFKNTLKAIIASKTTPSNATVISSTIGLQNMQAGNTYVVKGDIKVNSNISVPSNVTVYIEGSIHKNGNFNGADENKIDVIFDIKGRSNVKFIGINNAKISSNMKSVGFHINESNNVTIEGFRIENTWEAVSAQWNADNVNILNNHIINTTRRAIWRLGADKGHSVHNFIENAGWDGFDWDAYAKDNISFENVVVSAGRWMGFVEEAAQRNRITSNIGIMATFGSGQGFQMGWADNGTTQGIIDASGQLTQDNYFINNALFKPNAFRGQGGDYFSHINKGKGQTYFWGNTAFGAGRSNSSTHWYKATWTDSIPSAGQDTINMMDGLYNTNSGGGSGGGGTGGGATTPPSTAISLSIRHSNKCMDVAGSANGSLVVQNSCNNNNSQKFKFIAKSNGWYNLVPQHVNRCVDVDFGNTSDGTKVHIWDCNNNNSRLFKLEDKGNGWFNLVTKNANKCLDVAGVSTANNQKIHQWTCYNGQNQQFKFK